MCGLALRSFAKSDQNNVSKKMRPTARNTPKAPGIFRCDVLIVLVRMVSCRSFPEGNKVGALAPAFSSGENDRYEVNPVRFIVVAKRSPIARPGV